MTTFAFTKLNATLRAAFTLPPSIGTPPVLDGVNAGVNVTYTAAGNVSGVPTPTLTAVLYKNGVAVATGYPTTGGYNNTVQGDVLQLATTAINGFGQPALVFSAPLTVGVTQSFTPAILAAPVIGQKLYVATPGYSGSVTSYQWRRFKNSGGFVNIPGATSSFYTPTKTSTLGDSDVGAFFSCVITTPTGTASTQEFSSLNQVIAAPSLKSTASPKTGTNYINTMANPVTVSTVQIVRSTTTDGSSTNYFETLVSPGTYAGTTFGDTTQIATGATQFNCSNYSRISLGSPACIDAMVDSTPTTATRPAASTGIGFFNVGGDLYDANGNRTRLDGVNRAHYDSQGPSNSVGLFSVKANVHRLNIYLHRDWNTVNKPLMDDMVSTAHKVIPMLGLWYVNCAFTGSISGNTLTVSAVTKGVMPVAAARSAVVSATFQAPGVSSTEMVTQQLTNTNAQGIPGKEGTYRLAGTYGTIASQSMSYTNSPTGLLTPEIMIAAAQCWVENYANIAPYERWVVINIANEWGPSGSASNTVWRDTCIQAVGMLRAAGYKCPIVCDAPGSGQDGATGGRCWTILNHGQAVFASDAQANTMLDVHLYGVYQAGTFAAVAQQLRNFALTNGITVFIGEYGPAYLNAGVGGWTTAEALELASIMKACQLGRIWWAVDDPPNASGSSVGYVPYALIQNAQGGGYATSDPAQLTYPGKQVALDPVTGISNTAVAATVFP